MTKMYLLITLALALVAQSGCSHVGETKTPHQLKQKQEETPPPPSWQPARFPEPPMQPTPRPQGLAHPPIFVPESGEPLMPVVSLQKGERACPHDKVKQELLASIIKANEHLEGGLIDGLTELEVERTIAKAVRRAKNCGYSGGEETALNRRLSLIDLAQEMLHRPLQDKAFDLLKNQLLEAIGRLENEGEDMKSIRASVESADYVPPFSL